MIRTLPFFLGALMLSTLSYAQTVSEDFENGLAALTARCWQLNNINYASKSTYPAYTLQGNGSVYSDPPVNSSNFRTLATPFLDVDGAISLSLDYQLSSTLSNNATRIIEAGLVDKDGNYTLLQSVTLTSKTQGVQQFTVSEKSVTPGLYRVVLKLGGSQGDGNCRLSVDHLAIDQPYHYNTGCNAAPVAGDDAYTLVKGSISYAPSVLANDTDPNGEQLTPELVTPSPDGVVTLNADGTFTFVPNTGFTGTSTTFTYKVLDNGLAPAGSNTATVSIRFEKPETMELRLVSFSGKLDQHRVQLQWQVGSNELMESFEVERSTDGGSFSVVQTVPATSTTGDEQYEVLQSEEGAGKMFRLKMVNKKGEVTYSAIIKIADLPKVPRSLSVCNNPVVSNLDVRYLAQEAGRTMVAIYTSGGTGVFSGTKDAQKGLNLFSFPSVSALRPGTYILTITNEQGERLSNLFLKL